MRWIALILECLPSPPRHWLLYLWNLYPPFLGAGIRIRKVSPDFSYAEATLCLRWWNRNYVGAMFGGSLYSLCDAMHMVMLVELLGPGYVVRDKGADVRFLRKGVGTVTARFEIGAAAVAGIWADPAEVQERRFQVSVRNESGEVVAEVTKLLHVRRLPRS